MPKRSFKEADDEPALVFIQDYHFGLLPRMLKQRNPNLTVAHFWHIPWPNPETFRAFPWKDELLEGLLSNDLLGFHLSYHCQNFLETVDRNLESMIDRETSEVRRGGRSTVVKPFPISIDFEQQSAAAASPEVEREIARWRHSLKLANKVLGLGIERVDYTKGIPERLRAIDRLLETHPEYRGRLIYAQAGVPSRGHIRAYQQLDDEIDDLVESVNWKWGTGAWRPIIYEKRHFNQIEMMALHRLASFCVVSSLHDGLNLVAKEFVSSRVDEDGVLILSRFTGAARELTDAVQVNPFAVAELSEAMHEALNMPEDERTRRMRRMRRRGGEQCVPLGRQDRVDAPAARHRRWVERAPSGSRRRSICAWRARGPAHRRGSRRLMASSRLHPRHEPFAATTPGRRDDQGPEGTAV